MAHDDDEKDIINAIEKQNSEHGKESLRPALRNGLSESHTGQIPRSNSAPDPNSSVPGKKSVTIARTEADAKVSRVHSDDSAPRRKSTQGNAPRPSHDYDHRVDGPFGRPSLTMVRRQSAQWNREEMPRRGNSTSIHGFQVDQNELRPGEDAVAPTAQELEMSQTSTEVGFEPEPPPLNYSVWERKWFAAFFWTGVLIDCVGIPIALYYALWYHTSLSPNAVFSILTAALGGVSIFEYAMRLWRLWKKSSTCRIPDVGRWYFDWFHWNFSLGWIIVIAELIIGTIPRHPPIRLLSMPPTSMLFVFGTELLVFDILRLFHVPAPCRISSIPKGAQLRPCIYSMIEDIVAVDGSGGTEYRLALNKRYEASHVFRTMLRRLGLFWAISAETMAVFFTIFIFKIDNGEIAFIVGWAGPFLWAGIWSLLTWLYVRYMLRKEKEAWAKELAEKQGEA